MNSSAESFRRILKTSTITGVASVLNIASGIVRTKAAAVLLGPSGVGAIGLLQNLMVVATNIASLGFRTVGTRDVAEATGRNDEQGVAAARRALFWGTAALALLGGCVFYGLRNILVERVLHDSRLEGATAWLALGVALSVATGSQSALLAGMRRISDLARLGVISSSVSTVLAIAALYVLREQGLIAYILISPATTFLLGHWYVRKLGRPIVSKPPLGTLIPHWKNFVRLGIPFMLSSLVSTLGELLIRTLVNQHAGLAATGNFQAAWTISVMYTGFILTSMGADYYPRLSATVANHTAATRLINEQTQVALLLATPLIIFMVAIAPWVIRILYSHSFGDAATILRWQLLGDVLKLASWPLGYLLLASGDGKTYFLSEAGIMAVYVGVAFVALPRVGLQGAGIAFLAMYLVYLPMIYRIAARQIQFSWSPPVRSLFYRLAANALAVFAAAQWSDSAALIAGVPLASIFGVQSLMRLRALWRGKGAQETPVVAADPVIEQH